MSLRIQNNVEAFNAHRNLQAVSEKVSQSMERLSSGYRINRAADDSAGLAISVKLEAQIGGVDQAQRNAQDAISLVQTAEGSMAEVHSMLQRVRDLAVQFNNGSGATLNRVTGNNMSQIMGSLSATGSVYLINQQGVVIGKQGVITTGGSFVAKLFMGESFEEYHRMLKAAFTSVKLLRPESTRKQSREIFFIGKGFKG